MLARFGTIEAIPDDARERRVDVARAGTLAACLRARRAETEALCREIGAEAVLERAPRFSS